MAHSIKSNATHAHKTFSSVHHPISGGIGRFTCRTCGTATSSSRSNCRNLNFISLLEKDVPHTFPRPIMLYRNRAQTHLKGKMKRNISLDFYRLINRQDCKVSGQRRKDICCSSNHSPAFLLGLNPLPCSERAFK